MRSLVAMAAVLLILPLTEAGANSSADTSDPPGVVDLISLPGSRPTNVGFYAPGNSVFVTDNKGGNVLMIDGSTRQAISSLSVGGPFSRMVINETYGKVYVSSDGGISDGTGLISVIDANDGTLITQLDPGAERDVGGPAPGQANDFNLAIDEVRDKVYLSLFCPFCDPLGVIDVATDEFTAIPANIHFGAGGGLRGVNTVTNEAFAVGKDMNEDPAAGESWLITIDGDTLQVTTSKLPHGGFIFDVAVNEVDDKLYFFLDPLGSWSGLIILDRTTGTFKSIEHPDRESTDPLIFNPMTDTLFSGAGVNGRRGIIVDGATDELTYLRLMGNGMAAAGVRMSTDNAYFAGIDGRTFIVNGSTNRVGVIRSHTGISSTGGSVWSSIAVDQARGLVYVIHDDKAERVTIVQDGVIPPPPDTTITRGPSGKTASRTATFRFNSNQPNSTFRCKLDLDRWRKCTSPKRYTRLSFSRHVFRVKARNGLGMTDPTPAARAFRVVP